LIAIRFEKHPGREN